MPITQFEDPTYLEAVYAALFALLAGATLPGPPAVTPQLVFNLTERVVVVPDQIPPANQPALLLVEGPMHAEQREIFGPTKWILTAVAVIFIRAEGTATPSPVPAQTANYLIWAIAGALGGTLPPYDKQTLGGLVYHCWIEGEVLTEVIDQQVVIAIPINILPGPGN